MNSAFKLKGHLAANAHASAADVIAAKLFLQHHGFYQAPDFGLTEYPDSALFKAIEAFQKAQGLKPDGVIKPDGETETAIKQHAQHLQGMGRSGDTILAHINPVEAQILKDAGGSGTINPKTGLMEFWGFGGFGGFFGGSKNNDSKYGQDKAKMSHAEKQSVAKAYTKDLNSRTGWDRFTFGSKYGYQNWTNDLNKNSRSGDADKLAKEKAAKAKSDAIKRATEQVVAQQRADLNAEKQRKNNLLNDARRLRSLYTQQKIEKEDTPYSPLAKTPDQDKTAGINFSREDTTPPQSKPDAQPNNNGRTYTTTPLTGDKQANATNTYTSDKVRKYLSKRKTILGDPLTDTLTNAQAKQQPRTTMNENIVAIAKEIKAKRQKNMAKAKAKAELAPTREQQIQQTVKDLQAQHPNFKTTPSAWKSAAMVKLGAAPAPTKAQIDSYMAGRKARLGATAINAQAIINKTSLPPAPNTLNENLITQAMQTLNLTPKQKDVFKQAVNAHIAAQNRPPAPDSHNPIYVGNPAKFRLAKKNYNAINARRDAEAIYAGKNAVSHNFTNTALDQTNRIILVGQIGVNAVIGNMPTKEQIMAYENSSIETVPAGLQKTRSVELGKAFGKLERGITEFIPGVGSSVSAGEMVMEGIKNGMSPKEIQTMAQKVIGTDIITAPLGGPATKFLLKRVSKSLETGVTSHLAGQALSYGMSKAITNAIAGTSDTARPGKPK